MEDATNNGQSKFKTWFNNVDWNDVTTKGISVMNGLSGIAGTALQGAQINQNTGFENKLADYQMLANQDYSNINQLVGSAGYMQYAPSQNYQAVRGMTNGQKWGTFGSGILQGATAGSALGPWGALGGAVIGGVASGLGILAGNTDARIKTESDNARAQDLAYEFNVNRNAGLDNLQRSNNATSVVRAVARGGKIERHQMDIRDFAAKVLNQPKPRVVRKKCNGGVMIKINR